jgi:hypothetical protein
VSHTWRHAVNIARRPLHELAVGIYVNGLIACAFDPATAQRWRSWWKRRYPSVVETYDAKWRTR